jgi:hypothetical protein
MQHAQLSPVAFVCDRIEEIDVDGDTRYYANGIGEDDEDKIREILRKN